VIPGLAAMHTLFMREHNRLCDLIAAAPEAAGWDDEKLFQVRCCLFKKHFEIFRNFIFSKNLKKLLLFLEI
jgi:hypothetical protein